MPHRTMGEKSGNAYSRSLCQQELHVVGLKLTIHSHDRYPLDYGLGDNQAIKWIFVVLRQCGHVERVQVLNRKRGDRISSQPFWDKILWRLRKTELSD